MESQDPVIRDGFRVLRERYSPPPDAAQLAAHIKRKVTICNLFLNYKLSIKDIAKTLDEPISTLFAFSLSTRNPPGAQEA
jgi:hypothetical protein